MQPTSEPNFLDIEEEYKKMNHNLYTENSKYLVIAISPFVFTEGLIALQTGRAYTVIGASILLTIIAMMYKWFWPCKQGFKVYLIIFSFLFYFSCMWIITRDAYLQDPTIAFFFSFKMAFIEKAAVQIMSDLNDRILFSIIALITRMALVPQLGYLAYFEHPFPVIMCIFIDVIREKRNKRFFYSYLRSREQLSKFKELVVHQVPEAIVILSQDLITTLFANNSFLRLTESSNSPRQRHLDQFLVKEEIETSSFSQGRIYKSSVCHKKTLLDSLKNVISSDKKDLQKFSCIVTSQNLSNRTEDESGLVFQVKLSSIVWDDQQAFAVILHDITEHHTILSLKIADAEKDKVLATVSHELRTPLNGMLGMIQVLEKRIQESDLLRFLHIFKSSTSLLVSLVGSILDLNQIRANKIKLYLERIDMYELLKGIISLFEYQCQQKGIYLKSQVTPGTPRYFVSDKNRLSQVLINLVGNAQKFTKKGGIIITASVEGKENSDIKFSVQDTGIGISKEDKNKLFQLFGRLNQEDNTVNRQGVGLGLTISETLVQVLNKGSKETKEITVESEFGKGSTFSFVIKSAIVKGESQTSIQESFSLPHIPNETTGINEKVQLYTTQHMESLQGLIRSQKTSRGSYCLTQGAQLDDVGSRPTRDVRRFTVDLDSSLMDSMPYIVLVDDNSFNTVVGEHLLLSHGYRVKVALSGQDAIDLIKRNNHMTEPILLILMDCQMPVMDGYETTRILRQMMRSKKIPETPIVALTANDGEAEKEICKRAGMCDYLSKPLKDQDLARILKRYC